MLICSQITDIAKKYQNNVVVLGTFDGVHIGHQKIIRKAVALAKKFQRKSIVFTFANHPLEIIAPQKVPKRISTNGQKEADLEALGVDILMNIPFTEKLANISPHKFISILHDKLSAHWIVVGPNCTFGRNGEGTPEFLRSMEKKYNFITEVPEAAYVENKMVSSSRIRLAVEKGRLSLAAKLLGHPFTIIGEVKHGENRGHLLGVPTANIYLDDKYLLPTDGVYIVTAILGKKHYQGIANVGTNPTFAALIRRVEVNIFNFRKNIYGAQLKVNFLKKLRGEKKFASVDELLTQMKIDIKNSKDYFIR